MNRAPRAATALVVSVLMIFLMVGTAAAKVPSGQGLAGLADEGISNLVCDDPTITTEDVVVTRGGGAVAWTSGDLYLLQSIHVVGTVTTPDGSFPVEFSKSYGQRTGLAGEQVSCTFDQTFEEDGAVGEATGEVVLVRVP